ncbi:MAG: DUF2834 domain-containing protein [Reyranella sp.]|nr:DUF2834 domain-containing protein [Reyranella sp.]
MPAIAGEALTQRGLIVVVLVLFGALSARALWHHGYRGIVERYFQSSGAGRVFAELVIALTLAMVWMWRDARRIGRNPWPWLVATVRGSSFVIGARNSSCASWG